MVRFPFVLYTSPKLDLSAVTHVYNPIAEKNGFNQIPARRKKKPVRKSFLQRLGPPDNLSDFSDATAPPPGTVMGTPMFYNTPTGPDAVDIGKIINPPAPKGGVIGAPVLYTGPSGHDTGIDPIGAILNPGQSVPVYNTPGGPSFLPTYVAMPELFASPTGQPLTSSPSVSGTGNVAGGESSGAVTFGQVQQVPIGSNTSLYEGRPETNISTTGLYSIRSRNKDPYASDEVEEEIGLSSFFSSKIVAPVKKAVGKNVVKLVKRVVAVNVGGASGAVSGFIASGGNPVGAIAGAITGGAKAFHDVTKTGDPTLNTKLVYQSAGYGAGAGAVVGATSFIGGQITAAQHAASAAKAAEVGYGAASSTAGAAGAFTPAAAIPTQTAVASSILGGTKSLLASPLVKAAGVIGALRLFQPGQPPMPEAPGMPEGTGINISIPGGTGGTVGSGGGSYPVGTGYPSGGGYDTSSGNYGGGEMSASGQAPDQPGIFASLTKPTSPLPLLATALLIGYVATRKRRTA